MAEKVFLGIDLGASGGRVCAGLFRDETLTIEEIHRFPNGGVRLGNRLYWDFFGIWRHLVDGLRVASSRYGNQIVSVGVDTWGVDFGLLARNDELLGAPRHYRDVRTQGIFSPAFEVMPQSEIFHETGLQFMELNTLFQLFAQQREDSQTLAVADKMLLMPDLFHWLLSGRTVTEETNASTTQLRNPITRDWSQQIIDRFALPGHLFQEIVSPGTNLGPITNETVNETGMPGHVCVVLPPTHDTASAVMSVPAKSGVETDWCYISSGTWSLMGVEISEPVINEEVARLNFTNEGGVFGTTRFLKNIAGLWLAQECRRIWEIESGPLDWPSLIDKAAQSRPLQQLINPDDARFTAPANMAHEIAQACLETGQAPPHSHGEVIRCVFESLALRYRQVLNHLQRLIDRPINRIHIVGGGSQNQLLCQMTADACDRIVVAGPIEATVIGNVAMQAVSHRLVDSLEQAREMIGRSFPCVTYEPNTTGYDWEQATARFEQIVNAIP